MQHLVILLCCIHTHCCVVVVVHIHTVLHYLTTIYIYLYCCVLHIYPQCCVAPNYIIAQYLTKCCAIYSHEVAL